MRREQSKRRASKELLSAELQHVKLELAPGLGFRQTARSRCDVMCCWGATSSAAITNQLFITQALLPSTWNVSLSVEISIISIHPFGFLVSNWRDDPPFVEICFQNLLKMRNFGRMQPVIPQLCSSPTAFSRKISCYLPNLKKNILSGLSTLVHFNYLTILTILTWGMKDNWRSTLEMINNSNHSTAECYLQSLQGSCLDEQRQHFKFVPVTQKRTTEKRREEKQNQNHLIAFYKDKVGKLMNKN